MHFNILIYQMADHSEVMQGINRQTGVKYTALAPNVKGFHSAVSIKIGL